jgi:hypothetical protein
LERAPGSDAVWDRRPMLGSRALAGCRSAGLRLGWRPPRGLRPGPSRGAGQPLAIASCRPIGLRLTSAAAQLACNMAF